MGISIPIVVKAIYDYQVYSEKESTLSIIKKDKSEKGIVVLSFKSTNHSYFVPNTLECTTIFFKAKYLEELLHLPAGAYEYSRYDEIKKVLSRLNGNKVNDSAAIYEIFLMLEKELSIERREDNLIADENVRGMIKYLEENYTKDFSLSYVPVSHTISKSLLCKKFKTETGFTMSEYLNILRLNHSATLIQSTELKIEDIAIKSGFNSVSYFTKRFKKYFGVTPGKWRELNGDADNKNRVGIYNVYKQNK